MKYYGGKSRQGKEISDILKEIIEHDVDLKGYIEPFCGALGVMRHMEETGLPLYAYDACPDLILLWKKVQNNKFKKPTMTESKWRKLKYSKVPSALRAFAGFACSFGGIFFNGYADNSSGDRNFCDEGYKSIKKIQPHIKNVNFKYQDYKKCEKQISKGSYIIYCDPPYKDTDCTFGSSHEFNSNEFFNTLRKWSSMGNIIILSEFSAPKDFKCIWTKKRKSSIRGKNNYADNKQMTEKLYILSNF